MANVVSNNLNYKSKITRKILWCIGICLFPLFGNSQIEISQINKTNAFKFFKNLDSNSVRLNHVHSGIDGNCYIAGSYHDTVPKSGYSSRKPRSIRSPEFYDEKLYQNEYSLWGEIIRNFSSHPNLLQYNITTSDEYIYQNEYYPWGDIIRNFSSQPNLLQYNISIPLKYNYSLPIDGNIETLIYRYPKETEFNKHNAYAGKLDEYGNKHWISELRSSHIDKGVLISTDSTGNVYVITVTEIESTHGLYAGKPDSISKYRWEEGGSETTCHIRVLTKFNAAGKLIWSRVVSNSRSYNARYCTLHLICKSEGKIEIVLNETIGESDRFHKEKIQNDYYHPLQFTRIILLDSFGNMLQSNSFYSFGFWNFIEAFNTKEDELILSGHTTIEDEVYQLNRPPTQDRSDILMIVKMKPNHNIYWSMEIKEKQYYKLYKDLQDNLYVYGETLPNKKINQDIEPDKSHSYLMKRDTCNFSFLSKYNSDGSLIWTKTYPYNNRIENFIPSEGHGVVYPMLAKSILLPPHRYPIFNCQNNILPIAIIPNSTFFLQKIHSTSGELLPFNPSCRSNNLDYLIDKNSTLFIKERSTQEFNIYKIRLY